MKRQILIFLLMTISIMSFGQFITVSVVDSSSEYCSGSNGFITVTASGGTAPYSYVWNTTPPQTSATATNLSAGLYYLTVTDDMYNQTLTSYFISNLQPYCSVNVLQNDTNGLGIGILETFVTGGTPPYTFVWSANTGNQTTDTATNLSAGFYEVTIYDANLCSTTCSEMIITTDCSVNYILVPDTIPHHYLATSYVSSTLPPLAYYWSWGDGTFSSGPFPSHTYSVAGTYTICLHCSFAFCASSSYCDSTYLQKSQNDVIYVNVIPPATSEIFTNKLSNLPKVYPNPTNGKFTITETDNIKLIEVVNVLGKIIYCTIPENRLNKSEIDLSNVPKGIYFIKVDNGDKVHVEKVVLN
ncbi:MAG: T9SS type A sorting domain-containing protein [Bacteroidia bacterium]|nr:T9SS type A sorting domain-containing protein [Bacteroidia bacterium]